MCPSARAVRAGPGPRTSEESDIAFQREESLQTDRNAPTKRASPSSARAISQVPLPSKTSLPLAAKSPTKRTAPAQSSSRNRSFFAMRRRRSGKKRSTSGAPTTRISRTVRFTGMSATWGLRGGGRVVPAEGARLAGRRSVVDPVDAETREAPRRGRRARVPLVLERPTRVLGEERGLEREPEREREAPGSGFEALVILRAREPAFRVAHGSPCPLAGRGQLGVRDAPKGPVDFGGHGPEPARLRGRAQEVQREHVRRSLPDRQHLGVAKKAREARVLDVAGSAEAFEGLARDGHDLFSRRQLGDRRHEAQEIGPALPKVFVSPDELHGPKREVKRALEHGLEIGERLEMQGLLRERSAESDAPAGEVPRQRERAAHAGDGTHRV